MQLLWLLGLLPLAPTAFAQASNDSDALIWGAYRPNLYFGLRPRFPQSLMTGLMWYGTHDYQSLGRSRHACDQGDNLNGYTWTTYDAREGGVQVLNDGYNNVKITTEFIKVPGGKHGGSWAARIKGEPINPDKISRTSFIFYAGIEGFGGLDMETDEDENGIDGPIEFSGSTPDLDEFKLRIVDGPDNHYVSDGMFAKDYANRIGKSHFGGYNLPPGDVWQAKEYIMRDIVQYGTAALEPFKGSTAGHPDPSWVLQLSDETLTNSNLYAVQKMFDGKFQFDVFFESASTNQKLSSATLDEGIPALVAKYDQRFSQVFPVPALPDHQSLTTFSQAITSNLIGGVGYFYGQSIVDAGFAYEWDEDDESAGEEDSKKSKSEKGARLVDPKALLTATPSRSFFPRGFYWDEGFHLLHIGEWDNDLSLEILKDWISLIDEDGWVAREQILGDEARSKVPSEFQTQVPSFANPPTLTMAVTAFIGRVKAAAAVASGSTDELSAEALGLDYGLTDSQTPLSSPPLATLQHPGSLHLTSPKLALSYLKSIYEPLKRHYNWFRRTQRGQLKQYGRKPRSRTEAYRWRGRSEKHVLTSGMDDYPRGPPHAGELHLDLISWMGFFTRTMREIAEFVGEVDDAAYYKDMEGQIAANIDDLHWNEEEQMYCDVSVDDDDESYHVCHRGYLSLFPFLLELLPSSSPHLGSILTLLRDPDHLWSPYGIRSLSASHPEFGQGEDYWKGPIWVQMNYLTLKALYKTYMKEEGPYQQQALEIYDELRKNIISNEYVRTGYVWEQYDANNGEGRRSHPFTGWTSLVTLST
ncbi:glycoside hydrolase [Stereum hirsutum FP-91666 SS1]|uniref:glycoside hydrolase n=1 Tax=Stereum hirsutum (strain FP-91666) TaxID=721885 RepID=UPI000440BB2B|nr:glycoside hydrolase [Stereum hirsutum FP-91666 SS1]EIM90479.1 glycoside hydrolase [Stereum hirsutum FP-91666 SS1]